MVPRKSLTRANSLSSATETTVDLLGYPLAGGLVAGLWGMLADARAVEFAFYLDALTYGFPALMIYTMSVTRVVSSPSETVFGGIGAP